MRNGNIFTMKAVNDEKTSELFSQLGVLLGVSRGSDGKYHLADLCTAGSIAIGARYKPFRHPSDNFDYDINNPGLAEAERGFQSQLANFGISIPTAGFGDVKTMADAVYNGTYKWEYLKPQGRANGSPFRIRDFDGYKHDAISPIRAEVDSFEQSLSGTTALINPYFRITKAGDPYQLSIEELRFDTASWDYTFKDMYLGMCARRVSDGAAYYTIMSETYSQYLASTQHDEVSLNISVPVPSSGTYTYYCFPFFATGTTIGYNTMYPVPMSTQNVVVKKAPQVIENMYTMVDAYVYEGTHSPLYYQARFVNNTQSVFNNLGLEYTWTIWAIGYDGSSLTYIAQGSFKERVEPYGTIYLTGQGRSEFDMAGDVFAKTQRLICNIYYNGYIQNSIEARGGYISETREGDEPF